VVCIKWKLIFSIKGRKIRPFLLDKLQGWKRYSM
jgi:hypothetical protein